MTLTTSSSLLLRRRSLTAAYYYVCYCAIQNIASFVSSSSSSSSSPAFLHHRHITGTTTTTTNGTNNNTRNSSLMSTSKQQQQQQQLGPKSTSTLTIAQIPCLNDNYGYLIHDHISGHTAAVDTPDASAYQNELKKHGWTLSHIFNTHHHWDHTGGNLELKESLSSTNNNVTIYGPSNESIPGCDIHLSGGDQITSFGQNNIQIQIIDVGGHTKGHIAYYFPNDGIVFVGDSLFALGCGRMFEGTSMQFWNSLKRLRDLPDDTVVYCAHEYTQSNAKFAMSIEPNNTKLISRIQEINDKRSRNLPTVPSLLREEKETNPFLRVDISKEIQRNVGVTMNSNDDGNDNGDGVVDDHVIFGKVRAAKDNF